MTTEQSAHLAAKTVRGRSPSWEHTPATTEQWAEAMETARHRRLCTAIPFPQLDWSDVKATETNLEEMYAYAENLAHSVIDWYIRKCSWKKLWSVAIRFLIFAFAVMGILVPFLKFASPTLEAKILKGLFGHIIDNPSAAEVALILFGVAVGFHLIDHYAGFTSAWMRYMTAAMRISEELMKFQFDWNQLERESSQQEAPPGMQTPETSKTVSGQTTAGGPQPGEKTEARDQDSVSMRIELVNTFCFTVFKIVNGETSVWADELKSSIAQLTQHLPSTGLVRVGAK